MGSNRMTRPSREFDLSKLRLRHIRWIGGGSGAGKSTVARRLSERYGLRRYHCDDMQSAHTARSNPTDHPMLHAFIAMTMDERRCPIAEPTRSGSMAASYSFVSAYCQSFGVDR